MREDWKRYWLLDPLRGWRDNLVFYGLRLFSPETCSAIGAWLGGRIAPRKMPVRSERARRNLKLLRPDLDDPAAIENILHRRWENMGRFMTEFPVIDQLCRQGPIRVEGRERLDAAVVTGRPIIFIGLHIGNWELLAAQILQIKETEPLGIYEPPPNRFQERLLARARYGARNPALPPDGSTTRRIYRHLVSGRGRSLLIFVDEMRDRQIAVPAFGRDLPEEGNLWTAVRLAWAAKALLLPVSMRRLEGTTFAFEIGDLVDIARESQGSAQKMAAERVNEQLENIVRSNVDQWLPLHDLKHP